MSQFVIFPGQGAQEVGMGQSLAEHLPACRDLFDRASGIMGFDLLNICTNGPIEELTRSCNAQPAIFVVSAASRLAISEVFHSMSARLVHGFPQGSLVRNEGQMCPEAQNSEKNVPYCGKSVAGTAGLSSGEWAALYEAGVLSFEDTIRALRARGEFMQACCETTTGGMLTIIGLPAEKVREVAAESGLEVANFNSPEQTVLSGHADRLALGETAAKNAGAKRALRLTVAGAFHSSLMKPAADQLADFLKDIEFATPKTPVWSNVTGKPHTTPDEIRLRMVEQVYSSVRWVDCVQDMAVAGMTAVWECGPGKVLAGLMRRTLPNVTVQNIFDLATAQEAAKLPA